MNDPLLQLVSDAAGHPLVQALLIGVGTLFLEDPTVIGTGLLVADGQVGFLTAYISLATGITVGDFSLYLLGRFCTPLLLKKGWISAERLERSRKLVEENLLMAVFLSRFLPGTRIPTYVGAGVVRSSLPKFLGIAIGASALWTVMLLTLSIKVGENVLPLLGVYKWYIILAVLVAFLVLRLRKRWKRESLDRLSANGEPVVSLFEFWHPVVFYFPVGLYYCWLALRFRSISLPSLANPSVYSGGIVRESKSQIMSLVSGEHRRRIARYMVFHKQSEEAPAACATRAMVQLKEERLPLPIVAKPDQGQRGAGVRVIRTEEELGAYLTRYRADVPIVMQEFIDHPHEAGVLYYRLPGAAKGEILSVTLKEFPYVTGDGRCTLRELIETDARARLLRQVYFARHQESLERVLDEGEEFPLVFAGNHCQGAVFKNGTSLVTPELCKAIAAVADSMSEFYFGRFDIRFRSPDSFFRGEDFLILGINGASAEATHIWDARMTLREAYRALFRQFRILFEIGGLNRLRGFKPIGGWVILRDFWRYRSFARNYPSTS